jgi:hypothetical protein
MAFTRPLDYIDVAARLMDMREKFPDLTMQQVKMEFVQIAGKDWVVYTAAAYRTPDDQRPGIGTAWEPIPGPTPYTKDSEVQNAETAAWGRALVAIGASTKNGIASAEEVTNRTGGQPQEPGEYRNNQRVVPNTQRVVPNTPRESRGGGYVHGSGNTDFDIILQAATLSDNDFIHSLAKQIEEKGTLTDNQISYGVPKAFKIVNGEG